MSKLFPSREQGNITLVALAAVSGVVAITAYQTMKRSGDSLRGLKIDRVRSQAVDANIAALSVLQTLVRNPENLPNPPIYPDPYIDYTATGPVTCPTTFIGGPAIHWYRNPDPQQTCLPVVVKSPDLAAMQGVQWAAVMAHNTVGIPKVETTVNGVKAYTDSANGNPRYINQMDVEAVTKYRPDYGGATNTQLLQGSKGLTREVVQKTRARINLSPPPKPSCFLKLDQPQRVNDAEPVYYSLNANQVIVAATIFETRNAVTQVISNINVQSLNRVSPTFQMIYNNQSNPLRRQGKYQISAQVRTVDGQTVTCTPQDYLANFKIDCPGNGLEFMVGTDRMYCYYLASMNQNCASRCGDFGLAYDQVASDFLDSGYNTNDGWGHVCPSVLNRLGIPNPGSFTNIFPNLCAGCGCKYHDGDRTFGVGTGWYRRFPSNAGASYIGSRRACGCTD